MVAAGADRDADVLQVDPLVPAQGQDRGRLRVTAAGHTAYVDDLTKRRLAHNEDLFREVNEAREQSSARAEDTTLTFVCECSDRDCTGRIQMTAAEFGDVRSSERRYVVLPGHEIPEIERIVEDRGAFEIVEKDAA
jgi:hypothetical protein